MPLSPAKTHFAASLAKAMPRVSRIHPSYAPVLRLEMLSAFVTVKSLDSASQTSFSLVALHLASKHPNFLGQFLLIPWGPVEGTEGKAREGV